jgi:phosphatidylinositol glycan class T
LIRLDLSGYSREIGDRIIEQAQDNSTVVAVLSIMTVLALSSFLLSVLVVFFAPLTSASADYHERLLLRPLPPSSLLASFNFHSNASSSSFEQQNFRYFPRSLGQLLQHANTRELHLRFSLGRWDAESWGVRPWGGAREGGTGVELWAWVEAGSDEESVS